MSVCMTKSNKFEHLEITEIFLSFDKIGKFGTLTDTIIGFKLEAKKPVKKVDCSNGSRTGFGVLFTNTLPLCIISHQNKHTLLRIFSNIGEF